MIKDLVIQKILDEYHKGKTQQSIAKKYKCSQSYIASLISGARKAGGITLDRFEKMFPQAFVSLDGELSINSPAQINSPLASMSIGDGRIQKIITRIIKSDIPPEVKDKVLNIILDE